MINIGILAATKAEVKDILENKDYGWQIMDNPAKFEAYTSKDKKFVLMITGIGKVYATIGASMLGSTVDMIISFGSSGHLGNKKIGTVVISNNFIEHDMDGAGLGFKPGVTPFSEQKDHIISSKKPSFYKDMFDIDLSVDEDVVLSGDVFLSDKKLRDLKVKQFGKYSIDMESAAVAKVCNLFGKPFMTFRYITDNSSGEQAKNDWQENLKDAAKKFDQIFKIIRTKT